MELDPDLVCPSVCQSVFSPPVSPALRTHTHTVHSHLHNIKQIDTNTIPPSNTHTHTHTHTHQDTHLRHALVCVTRAICLLTRAVFYTFTFVFPLMPLTKVCDSTAVVHFMYNNCMMCKNNYSISAFYRSESCLKPHFTKRFTKRCNLSVKIDRRTAEKIQERAEME